MSTGNSQFDLSGIQLRESKTQPRVSLSREIGEAQIVHTIFGKAKVRTIRKNDKRHRTMWVAATLVVAAIGAVVLLGWYAVQQPEAVQSTDLADAESAQEQAVAPDSKSRDGEPPAISPSVKNKTVIPPLTVTSKPVVSRKSEPQQASGLKEAKQKDEKPVAAQAKSVAIKPKPVKPLTKSKSQTAPTTVTNNTLKDQTDKSQLAGVPPAAETSATPAATQHTASSPAAAVLLASPLDTEDTAPQSSADNKQLFDPINVQSN